MCIICKAESFYCDVAAVMDDSDPRFCELFLMDIFLLFLVNIWCPMHDTNLFIMAALSKHVKNFQLLPFFILYI